ncbi:MAG: small multi-drug export protein [Candidatus Bipolaricaulota bacterium]|nr:small multi-drug export protein [Candidatus Bipolaricaulota bacterium]
MNLARALTVVGVSAAPVAELRGGLPLAISLGFSPMAAFLLSVLGNLLPVVPLLLWLSWIERGLRRLPPLGRFLDWVFMRTRRKGRLVSRYGAIGLILLVAIPFPATGAWTGAIAAFLLGIPVKRAFPLITVGVLIAGLVVLAASLGAFHLFGIAG